MKFLPLFGLIVLSVTPATYGAAYVSDFEAPAFLPSGSDVAGQDGWSINDTGDQYSQIADSNANPADPFTVSQALNLGGGVTTPPSGPSVSLSHNLSTEIGTTSMNFDFIIADSTNAEPNRDTFGVSLTDGGLNVFTVTFVPKAQSPTPNSGPIGQWNLFYQVGVQPTVALNLGVLENSQYNFDLKFNPNVGNPLLSDFMLIVTSAVPNVLSDGATGVSLNPGSTTDQFSVLWANTQPAYGNNSIVIDNLSVIPEPSSSLLICLAGLGFISRRRRA